MSCATYTPAASATNMGFTIDGSEMAAELPAGTREQRPREGERRAIGVERSAPIEFNSSARCDLLIRAGVRDGRGVVARDRDRGGSAVDVTVVDGHLRHVDTRHVDHERRRRRGGVRQRRSAPRRPCAQHPAECQRIAIRIMRATGVELRRAAHWHGLRTTGARNRRAIRRRERHGVGGTVDGTSFTTSCATYSPARSGTSVGLTAVGLVSVAVLPAGRVVKDQT